MEVLYAVCCGLDVHKASVTACLRSPGDGPQRRQEVRTFGTSTRELLRLADWLSHRLHPPHDGVDRHLLAATPIPWRGASSCAWSTRSNNHESAGKRLSGRTRFANRILRQALVESARGAVFKRDFYLAAQYRRLVKRRGDKKAIVAVAHSILVIAYHVLRDGVSYRELGGDYFDRLNTDRLTRYHTKRLAALGYAVTLTKCAA